MKPIRLGHWEASPKSTENVQKAMASGRLSYGPFCREFEEKFKSVSRTAYAIFCHSGTAALHTALASLKKARGWADGDQVLLPATTFVATANAVFWNRLVPTPVDVDPRTFNIDTMKIEDHITERTRAIIPVHLNGLPCNMSDIEYICNRRRLALIEDSAQAIAVSHKGGRVGSFGEFGCFSTYMAHILTTGTGGFITTNDPELDEIARSFINHGRDSSYISVDDREPGNAGSRYLFPHLGHNFRPTELEAAIGCAEIMDIDGIVTARRGVASSLMMQLTDLQKSNKIQFIELSKDDDWSPMMFPLLVKDHRKRDPLMKVLEESGIETRTMFPLITQPCYGLKNEVRGKYPVSMRLAISALLLPCHQKVSQEDVERIAGTIRGFLK